MKLLMSKRWKVYSLIAGLLILTLFILACGDTEETPIPTATPATPIPTATPIDIAGITSEFQKIVQQEVEKIQPPLSEAEIRNLIETAISTGVPESVSAAEIQAMVNNAVAATAAEAVTGAEVTEAIGKAIVEAAATAPEPLTKSDIEGIVKAAIPAPTVAPLHPNRHNYAYCYSHADHPGTAEGAGPISIEIGSEPSGNSEDDGSFGGSKRHAYPVSPL